MRCALAVVVALVGCTPSLSTPVTAANERVVGPSGAPWRVAYMRECRGSITAPVVAPDQSLLTLCSAQFGFERGDYRGDAPIGILALLPGGRVLRATYDDDGMALGSLFSSTGDLATGAGFPEAAVVSNDGSRVVVAESGRVVVYALPQLEEEQEADTGAATAIAVGFLADGSALVASDDGCEDHEVACDPPSESSICTERTCTGRTVKRLAHGKIASLGAAFDGVETMTVATSGERALLAREDGTRSLVALPSGQVLAELPAEADVQVMALDAKGKRVAFFQGGELVISELHLRALVPLHRAPSLPAEKLVFSPDGHTLFIASNSQVIALREGAPASPVSRARYRPALPPGFETVAFVEEEGRLIERRLQDGEVVYEALLPPGTIARYRSPEDVVMVNVAALDPAEFGAVTLQRWAARVVERESGAVYPEASSKSWGETGSRSVELAMFPRDGCDPMDHYVRFTEHLGVLYRIEIEAVPGTELDVLAPAFEAFFDGPLGPPGEARAFAAAPDPLEGPC